VPAFHGITPANPPADLIPPACLAVDTRANSGILLVGTGNPGRVMRTRDADFMTFVGNNLSPPMAWVAEPGISLPTDAVTAVEFASPSVPGQAYAASAAGRVFRKLDVSTANPWEERTNCGIAGVREIAVGAGSADRLYVINEQRVRFSEDGGQTWGDRHGTHSGNAEYSGHCQPAVSACPPSPHLDTLLLPLQFDADHRPGRLQPSSCR
jgi:hypothetical protein